MIRFQYFSFLPTKEKALKYDGMFYRFSPHRITWSNDSYYVIGLNYKYNNEVIYRIDRMTSLEIMDEEAKPVEEGFDMDSFLKSNFLMFDGEMTRVTLKCEQSMMNSIVDKFGEDVETFYDAEQDAEHFYASIFNITENKATSMGVALLMPKTSVINQTWQLITTKRIPLYGNNVLCDSDRVIIGKNAEHYEVSYKSMFYRLRNLKMFEPRDIDEYIVKNLGNIGGAI